MGVWYTTLEAVRSATDVQESARNDAQLRRVIESASRSIDGTRPGQGRLKRRFYPEVRSRIFSTLTTRPAWSLPLGRYELISATTVVSGGITIAASDYILQPQNDGPPYDRIDLKQTAYSAWPSGANQQAIVITGVWGYRADETTGGALAEDLDTSETGVDVTNSAAIGVGSIIRVDSERMIVTGKSMLTTGQTLQTPMTASVANRSVAVTNGAAYTVGETLLLDSERMRILDIAGNTLTAERAVDGSVLAAHTGSTIFAPRTLTVERGALGTTAATHNTAAAIAVHVVPGLVAELGLAEAVNSLQQELGAYGRTAGSGEAAASVGLLGLDTIRRDAVQAYRRRMTWLGV